VQPRSENEILMKKSQESNLIKYKISEGLKEMEDIHLEVAEVKNI
jgi:hypothetical protein